MERQKLLSQQRLAGLPRDDQEPQATTAAAEAARAAATMANGSYEAVRQRHKDVELPGQARKGGNGAVGSVRCLSDATEVWGNI